MLFLIECLANDKYEVMSCLLCVMDFISIPLV